MGWPLATFVTQPVDENFVCNLCIGVIANAECASPLRELSRKFEFKSKELMPERLRLRIQLDCSLQQ